MSGGAEDKIEDNDQDNQYPDSPNEEVFLLLAVLPSQFEFSFCSTHIPFSCF